MKKCPVPKIRNEQTGCEQISGGGFFDSWSLYCALQCAM